MPILARLLVIALCLLSLPALAAGRIVAVVNDDAITSSDLDERLRLAITASGLSDSAEMRSRFSREVLRNLIDEKLQLQEAKRLNITVSDAEINEGITRIAKQNNMAADAFLAMLARSGVSKGALQNQLRAGLAWNKVTDRKIRPAIRVGDADVDALVERVKSRQGRSEIQLAEIFLPVDNPAQEGQVADLANRLVAQIRERQAPFQAVARQFSKGTGAGSGGLVGWVGEGQLPAELDKAAFAMNRGELSRPIRAADGFHILLIVDKRILGAIEQPRPAAPPKPAKPAVRSPMTLTLSQLIVPLAGDADKAVVKTAQDQAAKLRADLNGCASIDAAAAKIGSDESGSIGSVKLSQLAKPVQAVVAELPIGKPSPALRNGQGLVIFMVCKRSGGEIIQPAEPAQAAVPATPAAPPKLAPIDREAISRSLLMSQIEIRQRSYMRDLRESAFIEMRGQ